MRLTEILRLVWLNIIKSKSKAILTSLGIIVGSATIVLVIAIGYGGQKDVAEQFKNLNAGAIEVTVGQDVDSVMGGMMGEGGMPNFGGGDMPSGGMPSGGGGGGGSGGMPSGGSSGGPPGGSSGGSTGRTNSGGVIPSDVTLTTEDVTDLSELVPDLAAVSISANSTAAVIGGDLEDETDYTVVGVLSDYVSISNLELMLGDFIADYDEEDKAKVCVMGYEAAQEIFGSVYTALDNTLTIEGKNYTVIGILSQMGTVSSGISPDTAIYIPYSSALKFVFGNSAEPQISAVATDVEKVSAVMTDIETILTENYPDAKFTLTDAGSKMEAATTSANTLSMLLIAVASIVFIVGGIGIMNVLFVSVKERTQEIGILKALGCSKREVLLEFLFEANFISTFGGIVGVVIGFALIPIVRMTGMRVEPLAIGGILSLLFAVITGTVFGFYPAFKASLLTPIKALSQQ